MLIDLTSTAPHVRPASDWQPDGNDELVMYRNPEYRVEGGLRSCRVGKRKQAFSVDELWFVMDGRAVFRRDNGEIVELTPHTAVHFKEGWSGEVEVFAEVRVSYMRCLGDPSDTTPLLRDVLNAGPVEDWGPVTTSLAGNSRKGGIRMSRGASPRRAETGLWTCSPGTWRCEVKSDEFCHFLAGSSLYTHDSGETIKIEPDTLAFFPAGWKGNCEVRETVRKVYMIR